jgi:lipid II:glycine glycyltransferase (peptidoglycan interpeptide bridge formation enzyme)
MDYNKQINLISIEVSNQIDEINKQADKETRILRRAHNQQVIKQTTENDNSIINNYDMGFLAIEECIDQRISNLQILRKNIFTFSQIK